ncbi:unnamed protein product [Thelazia callipaeda]|uniref:COMM domain-containing protein n=1 Tax=Thelazia callipaeda TaxID=103827 RepID=A0A0N5CXR0_THECL|nr:unnamed protein product [Thelazia callipaeda]
MQTLNQCGIVNGLSNDCLTTITKPKEISNAHDNNNIAPDQIDLIEAITFASLYGFQAVPIRIKILLHRALSTLSRKRAEAVIRRTGWKVDDFERGFIQQVILFIKILACCLSLAFNLYLLTDFRLSNVCQLFCH